MAKSHCSGMMPSLLLIQPTQKYYEMAKSHCSGMMPSLLLIQPTQKNRNSTCDKDCLTEILIRTDKIAILIIIYITTYHHFFTCNFIIYIATYHHFFTCNFICVPLNISRPNQFFGSLMSYPNIDFLLKY